MPDLSKIIQEALAGGFGTDQGNACAVAKTGRMFQMRPGGGRRTVTIDAHTRNQYKRLCKSKSIWASKDELPATLQEAKLTSASRNNLPDDAFALPKKRAFPIHDANHVRAAWSRLHQGKVEGNHSESEIAAAKKRVKAKAKEYGIALEESSGQSLIGAIMAGANPASLVEGALLGQTISKSMSARKAMNPEHEGNPGRPQEPMTAARVKSKLPPGYFATKSSIHPKQNIAQKLQGQTLLR